MICCKTRWRTPGTCSDQVTALPKDTPGTFTELDLPLTSLVWHPAALVNEMLVMSLEEKIEMTSKFPTLGQLSSSTLQELKRRVQSGQAKWKFIAYYYYHCRSGLQMGQWKPWSLSSGTHPRSGGRLSFVFSLSPKQDITKSLLSPPISSLLPGALFGEVVEKTISHLWHLIFMSPLP